MLKEIMEQPTAMEDCMRGRIHAGDTAVDLAGFEPHMPRLCEAKRVVLLACGSSFHCGM